MKGAAKHFGALNSKVDATVLDAGNSSLRDAAERRELSLAEALQLADDANRLTRGDVDALLGWNELAHISVSDSHAG